MVISINKDIFKAYDIRGIYPYQIDEKSAQIIMSSLIRHFKPMTVLVSRDTRGSSPALFNALTSVIPPTIKAYYMELSTTPMLYFWAGKLNVDLSIMVTASHNPPEYNGFKISKENVYPVSGEEILGIIEEQLKAIPVLDNLRYLHNNANMEEIKGSILEYRKFLLGQVDKNKFKRHLKIACDCASGSAGLILAQLFKNLPVDATFLCMMPDGNFPNHHPNPLIFDNIKHLAELIKGGRFDLGAAFDGDADRVIFLDENGNPIPSDLMIIYIATALKKKKNIEKIFIDTRSSKAVVEELSKLKIEVQRIKAGHLYMRRKLAENKNCFAAELSGHYYYKENYNADAAILTLLLVLERLSSSNEKISEVIGKFKKYISTGELSYPAKDKDTILQKVEKYFSNSKKEYVDGISVCEDDFYLNVRKSNTENFIRVVIEAESNHKLNSIKEKVEKIILG